MSRYDIVHEETVPMLPGDIPVKSCYGRDMDSAWRDYPYFAAVKRNGRKVWNVGKFYKGRLLRQIMPHLKTQTMVLRFTRIFTPEEIAEEQAT